MASQNRSDAPDVSDPTSLIEQGHRYAFFQALRLLRLNLGEEAFAQNVRVRPSLNLSFPGNDIEQIEADDDLIRITANFFGLYGVSSPLPTFYTEDLIEEALAGNTNTRDFLDILHALLYPLLFRAWEKNRIWLAVTEKKEHHRLNQLMALLGLQSPNEAPISHDAQALLPYSGIFSLYPRSASGLQALVSGLLDGEHVSVEPCVPSTISIPAADRVALGQHAHQLGYNTLIGRQIDQRNEVVHIHIGPLSASRFNALLPGHSLHNRVTRAIAHYVGTTLECFLCLTIKPEQRQPAALGQSWNQLGLNTWLGQTPDADNHHKPTSKKVLLAIDMAACRQTLRSTS